ncbi:MAG: hypothetical protein LBP64_04130 [Tannerella sp.]|jgi:hypothetical protein|nr:hypothetical protein [Tannerella sp.]
MNVSTSIRTSLLATIPFGLFGIAWFVFDSGIAVSPLAVQLLFLTAALSMFVLLGIGWIKEFPRWSVPALGFCLFFSLYLTMISIPSFKTETLGYLGWIPLCITFIVCLAVKPSKRPLRQLVGQIRKDPTLLLFGFYGISPLIAFLICDETRSAWMIPVVLTAMTVLSAGLYLFLRSVRPAGRIRSVVFSGLLALAVVFTASFVLNT